MRFKVDENLPCECAQQLRKLGFDADTVEEEKLSGAEDTIVAATCRAEGRILITLDLDFANIRAYPPDAHPGIIVIRTKAQDKLTLLAVFHRVLPVIANQSPEEQLWIVEMDRVRIRTR